MRVKSDHRENQRGYALTEVLLAGVIAAHVLTVTATGISTSIKAMVEVNRHDILLMEVRNISNGLRAGLPISDVISLDSDWRWTRHVTTQKSSQINNGAILVTYEISRIDQFSRAFSFSTARIEAEQS